MYTDIKIYIAIERANCLSSAQGALNNMDSWAGKWELLLAAEKS